MAAWKSLEREVAKIFGVKRQSRGDDFGQRGVEIISPIAPVPYNGSVVECKYRSKDVIHPQFMKVHREAGKHGGKRGKTPVVIWNDRIIICWLSPPRGRGSFDDVSLTLSFLSDEDYNTLVVLDELYVAQWRRKIPDYLIGYINQASEYAMDEQIVDIAQRQGIAIEPPIFPCVCLKSGSNHGILMIFEAAHLA